MAPANNVDASISVSEAMARYVTKVGQACSFEELYEIFGEAVVTHKSHKRLRDLLHYLVRSKRLSTSGCDENRRWHPVHQWHAAPLPVAPLPVVPPRQIDRLHGPVYVPGPGPDLRLGALDAMRLPSMGLRC